jgi:hypothetical protein
VPLEEYGLIVTLSRPLWWVATERSTGCAFRASSLPRAIATAEAKAEHAAEAKAEHAAV